MKYLFILLLAFLVSCGDNHGGDDDIIDDTTLTPPSDTLGVDSAVTFRNEIYKTGNAGRFDIYGEWWGVDNVETMENIQKRKGVNNL